MELQNQKINFLYYFILAIFLFFSFYFLLGYYAIENVNEGLYAEIAREIYQGSSWIIPHLNYLPYIEKPPMLYWLMALSYHIFGVNAFAARFVPASSAAITCLGMLYLGLKLNRQSEGFVAAMILASGLGFMIIARVILFDMLMTCLFTWAAIFFYLWFLENKKYQLRICYTLVALSILVKGLVTLAFAGLIVLIFFLISKSYRQKFLKFLDPIGIVIFLLISIPWNILAAIKQPGFLWHFFVNEQLLRFLNQRVPHDYHTGPIYFYIPLLIIYLFPWTLFSLTLFSKKFYRLALPNQLHKFLWTWFLVPFIFFSLSGDKGSYYMLIGTPPLAYLLAIRIQQYLQQNRIKLFAHMFSFMAFVIVFSLGFVCIASYFPSFGAKLPSKLVLQPFIAKLALIILIVYAIYSGLAILINYKLIKKASLAFILIAGLSLPAIIFLVVDKKLYQSRYSEVAIAHYINATHPQWPVYYYQNYDKFSSLTFYLKKRVGLINTQSADLYFGVTTQAAKDWVIDLKTFKNRAKKTPAYVVLMPADVNGFIAALKPIQFCQALRVQQVTVLKNRCD